MLPQFDTTKYDPLDFYLSSTEDVGAGGYGTVKSSFSDLCCKRVSLDIVTSLPDGLVKLFFANEDKAIFTTPNFDQSEDFFISGVNRTKKLCLFSFLTESHYLSHFTVSPLVHAKTPVFKGAVFGVDQGVVSGYLLMERIHQENFLREQHLYGIQQRKNITAYLVHAFNELNTERNVYHRDLKVQNILAASYQSPFLLDFSYARPLSLDHGIYPLHAVLMGSYEKETTNILWGSPWIMTPEYIATRTFDPTSDVFALGVNVYELLTKQRFSGNNPDPISTLVARSHFSFTEWESLRQNLQNLFPHEPEFVEGIAQCFHYEKQERSYAPLLAATKGYF